MSVAGEIIERLQFAKDGEIGIGAKNPFELGQIGDLVPAKVLAKLRGIEGRGPHNVRVRTPYRGIVRTIT